MGTNDVLGGLRHPLLCDVSCDVCFGNHKNRLFTPAHSGNSTKFVCNGLKKKNCLELTIKTNITTFQISAPIRHLKLTARVLQTKQTDPENFYWWGIVAVICGGDPLIVGCLCFAMLTVDWRWKGNVLHESTLQRKDGNSIVRDWPEFKHKHTNPRCVTSLAILQLMCNKVWLFDANKHKWSCKWKFALVNHQCRWWKSV